MSEDIMSFNDNKQKHGYWEVYYFFDARVLWYKGFFYNGKRLGYEEYYCINAKLVKKTYHI